MFKLNLDEIYKEIEKTQNQRISIFGEDFLSEFSDYMYLGNGLDIVGSASNHSKLFKSYDKPDIPHPHRIKNTLNWAH